MTFKVGKKEIPQNFIENQQDNIAAMLMKFTAALQFICINRFPIALGYPKTYQGLREYLLSLKANDYNHAFQFLGCLIYPADYVGAHNHFVLIDKGLITKFLTSWEYSGSYQRVRALVCKHLLGFGRDDYLIKNSHVDVFNINDFDGKYSIEKLKELVQKRHPSMPRTLSCRLVRIGLGTDLQTVSSAQFAKTLS